jgi:hypothetical protein
MFRTTNFILRETLHHRSRLSHGNLSRGVIGSRPTRRMLSFTRHEANCMASITVRAFDILSMSALEASIPRVWNLSADEDDDGG